jgi:DMSO reductase anchor subunit
MLPARQQALWGWPAVIDFALGGLGAGWYVVALLAAGLERSPGVTAASWAAPVLVLAGFAAASGGAGRPLRGPRGLAGLRTSWMSRERLIGVAFAALVIADLIFPLRLHRVQAAAAAVLLALAQGFILRRARAIPAWSVSSMPLLFLGSALLSGAGAHLLLEAGAGRAPARGLVLGVLVLIAGGFVGWAHNLFGTPGAAFAQAVAPLREGAGGVFIAVAGYGLPLLLGALAAIAPHAAPPALGVAGALLVAGQLCTKARLIRSAGLLRPITLAIASPRARRSP